VAVARGPGRPGLRRYRQGGLACQSSARTRWSRSPAGRLFRWAGLLETMMTCGYYWLIIITKRQRAKPQSAPSSQRTHKERLGDSCGATGSRARSAHRPHRVLALGGLVAAACGPSRPGLQCYRQGGLDCLASSRARWGRSLVGQLFRGLNFGDDDDLRLLLSNNYNQAATDQTTKRTKLTKYCTKIGLAILARLTTAAPGLTIAAV
jgi:hypothetical protein